MSDITEQQALDALRLSRDVTDEERRRRLGEVVRRYKEQQEAQSRPMFEQHKKSEAERYASIRRLYQDQGSHGLDKEAFREMEELSGGDPERKAYLFNSQYLAAITNTPAEKIEGNYHQMRSTYSQGAWGKEVTTDTEFATLLKADFDLEDEIGEAAQSAAFQGMPSRDSFAKWKEGREDLYGHRADDYRNSFSEAFRATQARVSPYRDLVDATVTDLEEKTGVAEGEGDEEVWRDIGTRLAEVPDVDRGIVLAAIAAHGGSSEKGGGQKSLENLGRGLTNYFGSIEKTFERDALLQVENAIKGGAEIGEDPERFVSETRSSILDSTAPLGTGFFSSLGVEDLENPSPAQEAALAEVQRRRDVSRLASEIKNIAENNIDPAEGEFWLSRGWYGALQSAPYMVAAASVVGNIGNGISLSDQAYDTLREYNPDLSETQLQGASQLAAVPMTFIERLQFNVVRGKFPALFNFLNRPTLTATGNLSRYPARVAAGAALETVQENLQDATPVFVNGLADALSEDVPGIDWRGYLEEQTLNPEYQSELLAVSLIFGAWGGGAASWSEIRGSRELASRVSLLKAQGIDAGPASQIRRLALAGKMEEAQTLMRQEWKAARSRGKTVPEAIVEAQEEYIQETRRKVEALEKYQGLGFGGQVDRTRDGYTVTFSSGTQETFEQLGEANRAVEEDLNDQMLGVHASMRDTFLQMVKSLEEGKGASLAFSPEQMDLRRGVEEGKVTEEKATERAEIAAQEEGRTLEELREEAVARGHVLADGEGDVLAMMTVLGENQVETDGEIRRTAIKLYRGATWRDIVEEKLEGDAKDLLAQGQRDWMIEAIREVETVIDQALLLDAQNDVVSDQQVIEAWSSLGKAYLLGEGEWKAKSQQEIESLLGTKAGAAADGYVSFLQMLQAQAETIQKAKEEGKLPAEFEKELSKQLGLEEQQALDEETDLEVQDIIQTATGQTVGFESIERLPPVDGMTFSITAHHGTPHQVAEFTTEKIGTGEGNQAYGWGLYFAEKQGTAEYYRNTLGGDYLAIDGKTLSEWKSQEEKIGGPRVAETLFYYAREGLNDLDQTFDPAPGYNTLSRKIKFIENELKKFQTEPDFDQETFQDAREELKAMRLALALMEDFDEYSMDYKKGGNVYTVTLHATDQELLDWDKPLAEQPELVQEFFRDHFPHDHIAPKGHENGSELYNLLQVGFGESREGTPEKRASLALHAAGIKGLRYLDGSSRNKGEGTYNYVVFDDSSVTITQANGESTFSTTSARQDAAYLAAVQNGDLEVAQAMVDQAAQAAGFTIKMWRGDADDFKTFDPKKQGDNFLEFDGAFPRGFFWFTSSPENAKWYAEMASRDQGAPIVREFYLNPGEVFEHDAEAFADEGEYTVPSDSHELAEKGAFDSMKVHADANWIAVSDAVRDGDGNIIEMPEWELSLGDYHHRAITDPARIKSADPVTYDEQGNVIPLSQRFDQGTGDINFSVTATVAPLREDNLDSFKKQEAEKRVNSSKFADLDRTFQDTVEAFGVEVIGKQPVIGGWLDSRSGRVSMEVPLQVELDTDAETARLIAGLVSASAPELQDAALTWEPLEESDGRVNALLVKVQAKSADSGQEIAQKWLDANPESGFTFDGSTRTFQTLIFGDSDTERHQELARFQEFTTTLKNDGLVSQSTQIEADPGTADFPGEGSYGSIVQAARDRAELLPQEEGDRIRAVAARAEGRIEAHQRALEAQGTEGINFSVRSRQASLRMRMTRKKIVEAVFASSDWKDFYTTYQHLLEEYFGEDADAFQDILSITSQAASVASNVSIALRMYGYWKRGEEFDGRKRGEEKAGALEGVIQNLERWRDDVAPSGRKIANYAEANNGSADHVVVDRHVARMLFNTTTPTKAQFEKAEKVLTQVAQEIGWEPRQVQAAIWAASIRKSGKEPESYDAYLRKLRDRGTLFDRTGTIPNGSGIFAADGGDGRSPSRPGAGTPRGGLDSAPYKDRAGEEAGEPLTETEIREGVEDESGTLGDIGVDEEAFNDAASDLTFSVSSEVPVITRESLKGKKKFIYFSDRTRVGEYTGLDPESGIRIDLQGGPSYPYIEGHGEAPAGWAFTTEGMFTRFSRRVNETDGIGLTTLYAKENLRANPTFLLAYVDEVKWAIEKGTLTTSKFLKESNRLRVALKKSAKWKPKSDWAPLFSSAWKSVEDFSRALEATTFEVRASAFFDYNADKKGANKGSKIGSDDLIAKGFPNISDMVDAFSDPAFEGIPAGTVIGAIQFEQGQEKPTAAADIDAEEHLSYPVVIKGKGIGHFSDPAHILDIVTDSEKSGRALVRSAETSMMPLSFSVVRGPAPERFEKAFSPFMRSPRLRQDIAMEAKRRAIAAADEWRRLIDQHSRFVDNYDQKRLIKALRTVNAVMAALPPEVRAKLGSGYIQVARFKSDEGRMQGIERLIRKIDKELDFYLRRNARDEIEKLFKQGQPKREEGKKAKSAKFTAEGHVFFDYAEGVANLSPADARKEAAGIESILQQGIEEADIEQASLEMGKKLDEDEVREFLEEKQRIAEIIGGSLWGTVRGQLVGRNPMDGDAMTAAHELVEQMYFGFRGEWWRQKILEKQQREVKRRRATKESGGSREDRDQRMLEAVGIKGIAKNVALNLLSFDGVARILFGEKQTYKWLSDWERRASAQKDDAVFQVSEQVEDFFTYLAGGDRFAGQELQHRLSQKVHEVGTKGTTKRTLSEMEIIDAILTWRQEDGERHMVGPLDDNGKPEGEWHYSQAWIDKAKGMLSVEALSVADYLIEQYQAEWEKINPVYRKLNGVNLPRNGKYSPISVVPSQTGGGQVTDPVTGASGSASGLSATPGFFKTRRKAAVAEPNFMNAVQKFLAHKRQVEHWLAYAEFAREARTVLNNRTVSSHLEGAAGRQAVAQLRAWIDHFEAGGNRDAAQFLEINQMINRMAGRAAAIALVGRIGTIAVQSTQLAAATAKMPAHAYAIRLGRLFAGQLSWGDALRSEYIQRRVQEMPPIVQQAMEGLDAESPSRIREAVKRLGKLIPAADALFTSGTYAMVLDYQKKIHLDQGFSEKHATERAHKETERIMDQIAQPTRAGARSFYEVSATHPGARLAFAFASEPRKNLALMLMATLEKNPKDLGRAMLYTVILNAGLAALIRNVWRDARDDEDDELFDSRHWNPKSFALTLATDWMAGFPILGDAAQAGIYKAAGEYLPQGNLFSGIERAAGGLRYMDDIFEGDLEVDEAIKLAEAGLSAAGIFDSRVASFASLSHLVRDLYSVGENASTTKQ